VAQQIHARKVFYCQFGADLESLCIVIGTSPLPHPATPQDMIKGVAGWGSGPGPTTATGK